ncbi:dienelactone hydrolase family protein [Nonomuraea sp. NBC_01738]|uniref:dienelactone hydrolase family protein n=1 Tax=Nonomuraea sp. NBC_01738 TaxID=2976003 RepID=UPI002E0D9713|nr:dienelactone hydrolase family protein [Nonomuraea sp. NBC_01738]
MTPIETATVQITTTDGPMSAYIATPVAQPADDHAPGSRPGVIVAHQLFGVTRDVRAIADRLAAAGYTALAPDFFHREAPGVQLTADDEGRKRGFELLHGLSRTGVLEDVRAAGEHLTAHGAGAVGMLGLSMGGHLAFYAATQLDLPVTVVLYAGWLTGADIPLSRPDPTLELSGGIKGLLVYIVGDRDHVITAADREAIAGRLRQEGVRHEMVVVEGAAHAFLSEPGRQPYQDLAWERVERALAELR